MMSESPRQHFHSPCHCERVCCLHLRFNNCGCAVPVRFHTQAQHFQSIGSCNIDRQTHGQHGPCVTNRIRLNLSMALLRLMSLTAQFGLGRWRVGARGLAMDSINALRALPASALMESRLVFPGMLQGLLELLELINVGRAPRLSDVTEPADNRGIGPSWVM